MKRWKYIVLTLLLSAALVAGIIVGYNAGRPGRDYARGEKLRAAQRWDEAAEAFAAAGNYRDAPEQILETRYQQGEALRDAGQYDAAYAAYLQASGYRDADEILAGDAHFRAANEQLAEATAPFRSPGTIVTFGRYEQDGDADNGGEPIEWLVLEQQEDRALLVSLYGLDCQPYHTRRSLVTWEKCSLRRWLNSDFLGAAFDDAENQAILKTRVDNSKAQSYALYSAGVCSDTQDKVFLLSYAEAWKYFPTDAERATTATAFATAQGAYKNSVNGNCWWWLRTGGNYGTCAMNVHYDGKRGDYLVHDIWAAVRPAIWVDLHSPYFSLGDGER